VHKEIYKNVNKVNYGYPEDHKELILGRNALTDKEKIVYDIIYNSVQNVKSEISIPRTPQKSMGRIYGYYLNDSPEHFYIDNIHYKVKDGIAVGITFNYLYSPTDIQNKKDAIYKKVNTILYGTSNLQTDYEKSKYIYDYIINNTVYDTDGTDSIFWIDGVFLNGKAVCQGYAKAFQLLTGFLGINSVYVRGQSRDINHGWNLVEIDGEYYHVDSTWGDLNVDGQNGIDYSYLNLTDAEILMDHTIDISKNPVLPIASSTDDNYFIKNDLVIFDYKKEQNKMIDIVKDAMKNGKKNVTIKFDNPNQILDISKNNEFLSKIVFTARDGVRNEGFLDINFQKFGVVQNEALQTINIIFS